MQMRTSRGGWRVAVFAGMAAILIALGLSETIGRA